MAGLKLLYVPRRADVKLLMLARDPKATKATLTKLRRLARLFGKSKQRSGREVEVEVRVMRQRSVLSRRRLCRRLRPGRATDPQADETASEEG